MCLLNENVSINRKYAYLMKICLLKVHNSLGINCSSYSTSSLSSFLETQETCENFLKLLFVESNKLDCVKLWFTTMFYVGFISWQKVL